MMGKAQCAIKYTRVAEVEWSSTGGWQDTGVPVSVDTTHMRVKSYVDSYVDSHPNAAAAAAANARAVHKPFDEWNQ